MEEHIEFEAKMEMVRSQTKEFSVSFSMWESGH